MWHSPGAVVSPGNQVVSVCPTLCCFSSIPTHDPVLCFSRYTDMESEDYHFYQGLVYLLENDVSTLGYDLTFSTEVGQETLTAAHAG